MLDLHREDKELSYKTKLEPIIEQIKMLISTQMLRQKISIEAAIADKVLEIPLPSKLLNQVLLNLILNAQDAMPQGGVIHILANRDNDGIVINVSDEGTGISKKNILMIFSPFFTTKGTKGTGLGLSITHSIITEAGGKIEVESEPNKGTTFSIFLPYHKEESL